MLLQHKDLNDGSCAVQFGTVMQLVLSSMFAQHFGEWQGSMWKMWNSTFELSELISINRF